MITIPMTSILFSDRVESKSWCHPGTSGLPYDDTPPGTAGSRAFNGFYLPAASPKFKLSRSPRIFAIGSCFAREIERALHHRGVEPLSWSPASPIHGSNFNRYNPWSMLLDLEFSGGRPRNPDLSIMTSRGWTDFTGYGSHPTREECEAVRASVVDAHRHAASADVVVATFGMIETWYDKLTNTYLNTAPLGVPPELHDRFELRVLSHSDCLHAMIRLRELVRRVNPSARILSTTSPVPLNHTFHGIDAGISNTQSKTTLRSAVGEFASMFDDVDYFPSYEIVTLSDPALAWLPDKRHVAPAMIETIISYFIDNHMEISE